MIYVVYTGIGTWGANGASMEKQCVVVERDGKVIANVKCSGKLTSLLGPDWFEKVGVSPNVEDFAFPD
jgi:hypothetical protein